MVKRSNYTRDEFLGLRPKRRNFEWTEKDGKVIIKVPKFKSKLGEKFCRLLGRDPSFTANLDEKGSLIWKMCDGKHTVDDILKELEKRFSDEEDLDQRLFLYLYNLKKLDYIIY